MESPQNLSLSSWAESGAYFAPYAVEGPRSGWYSLSSSSSPHNHLPRYFWETTLVVESMLDCVAY